MAARDEILSERQHKVMGLYLAICCWLTKLDAIVVERQHFMKFLGLKRVKAARVKNFQKDIQNWFPQIIVYKSAKDMDSLHSIVLSRKDLSRYLPNGTMKTNERVAGAVKNGLAIESLTNLKPWGDFMSEKEVVSFVAQAASGLYW